MFRDGNFLHTFSLEEIASRAQYQKHWGQVFTLALLIRSILC